MLQSQLMVDSHLLNTGVKLRPSCQTLTEVHEQAGAGFVLPEFKTEKRKKASTYERESLYLLQN